MHWQRRHLCWWQKAIFGIVRRGNSKEKEEFGSEENSNWKLNLFSEY